MMEMVHVVPVQKVSCVAEFAKLPGLSTPMSLVVLSEARVTWYKLPLYAPKRARTVLWAEYDAACGLRTAANRDAATCRNTAP